MYFTPLTVYFTPLTYVNRSSPFRVSVQGALHLSRHNSEVRTYYIRTMVFLTNKYQLEVLQQDVIALSMTTGCCKRSYAYYTILWPKGGSGTGGQETSHLLYAAGITTTSLLTQHLSVFFLLLKGSSKQITLWLENLLGFYFCDPGPAGQIPLSWNKSRSLFSIFAIRRCCHWSSHVAIMF